MEENCDESIRSTHLAVVQPRPSCTRSKTTRPTRRFPRGICSISADLNVPRSSIQATRQQVTLKVHGSSNVSNARIHLQSNGIAVRNSHPFFYKNLGLRFFLGRKMKASILGWFARFGELLHAVRLEWRRVPAWLQALDIDIHNVCNKNIALQIKITAADMKYCQDFSSPFGYYAARRQSPNVLIGTSAIYWCRRHCCDAD